METNTIRCAICDHTFDNVRKLSKHLNHTHKINLENYFSSYVKNRSNCVICGNPARFISYHQGYSECCSSKSCCHINFRIKLRNDKIKYEQFRKKVSNNMTNLWKTDQSQRIANMTEKVNIAIANMSKEEKISKYGHLNKLSSIDRKIFIENMLKTGCHAWWQNATEEEKQIVYDKRWKSIKESIKIRSIDQLVFSEKELEKTYESLNKFFNI